MIALRWPSRSRDPEARPLADELKPYAQTAAVSEGASVVANAGNRINTAGFDELLAKLQKMRFSGSVAGVEELLLEIAEKRPELAIELAHAIGHSEAEISQWTCTLVGSWAGKDSEAAWHWLTQQTHRPEVNGNTSLLNIVFDQMAVQDPNRLLEIVNHRVRNSNATNGFEPQIMAQACMDALIRNGDIVHAREMATEWTGELDPSCIGSAALESVALHMARSSPSEAAEWLKALPNSEGRNFALGTLASDWANRDPSAAMEWASSLKTDEGRGEAMQRAYSEWVERDPARAAEWLDRELAHFRFDPKSDQMVTSLIAASPMVQTDGEGALQWAKLIAEPSLRLDVIAGVFLRWLRTDRPFAERYLLKDVELTNGQKSDILKSYWNSRHEKNNED
jgi:hypothetical protein